MKNFLDKKKWISLIYKVLIAGGIILVDLLTKSFFQSYFVDGDRNPIIVIEKVISFVYIRNTGAAFGIFADNAYLLAIFSVVFVLAFLLFDFFCGEKNTWYFLGFSFILGGAIGNMVDRIAFGYVRDFIYLNFMDWFPVFNVADVFLSVGMACFVVYIIFYMFKEEKVEEPKVEKLTETEEVVDSSVVENVDTSSDNKEQNNG
jgi:signal peptidase II